jgi:predicted phosphate transport protein (TIGR00153 family)
LSENKSNLLDWFGKRRESVVTKGMRDHAQKVGDTLSELNRAMNAMTLNERDRAMDAIRRLLLSEKEADNIEDMMTGELSKGDLEARQREDLMHLVRRLDYVADWAKEAGMNLQLILEANVEVPVSLWRKYLAMTQELERAGKELKASIDALGLNSEEVLKHERNVDVLEHILDEMYFSTKKEIFFAQMDVRAIYIMRDLLHSIENSADKCKDAADILHILVISSEMRQR